MRELIDLAVAEKDVLLAKTGHRALPGAVALVQRLARRSPLALVSGASGKEVRDALSGIGVRDLFSVIVTAEDYAHGKPSPEPYLTGLTRLGVAAARSIVIEDATPGILSARAAGIRVIGVQAGNFVGYDLSPADVVVDTLDDVTDALCARLLA
jgi:HAD superfamily hydrolase (TIGR01509 family)